MYSIFQLDIYDKNRNWIAPVGAFESIEGIKRFDNISDLEFTVKSTHNRLNELMTPGTRIGCRLRGHPFIAGPIRAHDGYGPGKSGKFTFEVEDNFRILRNFLIYQVPGGSMLQQADSYRYQETGNAETVFKNIVTLNMVDRSIEPIIVAPNLNRGGTVTASARMAKVYNEMFPLLESVGLGVTVVPSPAGLTVDVYAPGVYPIDLTENSRIVRKWRYRMEAPDLTNVVVGGSGKGTARVFINRVATDGREALWNDRIEGFIDARDADSSTVYTERADEALFDGAGTASMTVTLAETKNFKLGGADGLNVGQVVTARVANGLVSVTDILREIEFSWNADDGLKLTGQIGIDTSPTARIAKSIAMLAGSVSKLKASE